MDDHASCDLCCFLAFLFHCLLRDLDLDGTESRMVQQQILVLINEWVGLSENLSDLTQLMGRLERENGLS